MFKKILLAITILILPIIFCFLIYIHVSQIRKSRDEFNLNVGTIENFGTTIRFNKRNNFKEPNTSSKVFFIKLENNDTIYSYFSRSAEKYAILKRKLQTGKIAKIFNEGYDNKQNTVDIVELEVEKEIFIKKTEFNINAYVMLSLFSAFLVLYFFIPYKFVYLKSKGK